jgi:hypothetical protein
MSTNTDLKSPPGQVVHPLPSIHTAKLPTIDLSLDYALMCIGANTITPWTSLAEWIHADSCYLFAVVNGVSMLVLGDKVKQVSVVPVTQTPSHPSGKIVNAVQC